MCELQMQALLAKRCQAPELDEIVGNYRGGNYDEIAQDISRLLVRCWGDIYDCYAALSKEYGRSDGLLRAVETVIQQRRGVCALHELRDQFARLDVEYYLEAERLGHDLTVVDRERVAFWWITNHSANWKRHRINEIFYVLEEQWSDRYYSQLTRMSPHPSSAERPCPSQASLPQP